MRNYIIEVTGDVIAKEGVHYAQSWTAGGSTSWSDEHNDERAKYQYEKRTHSVNSNLILDMTRRAVPYASYVSYGETILEGNNSPKTDLICCPGYYPAVSYFKEYISLIEKELSIDVPPSVRDTYYRGLFVDTFSVIELFLSDYILCGIFSDEECFSNALKNIELNLENNPSPIDIENKIRNYLTDTVVFHRFDKVSKLYNQILGCSLPDTSKLQGFTYKRDNFVHRYNLSNQDRMTVCKATQDDVRALMNECVEFVSNMYVEC